MGAFWFKQPNGLYGRFSTVVDCPTHWNYTKEEMIEDLKGKDWTDLEIEQLFNDKFPTNWIHSFEEMKKHFIDNNMTNEEFEDFIKEVSCRDREENENES